MEMEAFVPWKRLFRSEFRLGQYLHAVPALQQDIVMTLIRFDTTPFPLDRRLSAWNKALEPSGLAFTEEEPKLKGHSASRSDPQRARFTFITADAGRLNSLCTAGSGQLILGAVLEGKVVLADTTALYPRQMACWADQPGPCLEFNEPTRLLLLRLPDRDPRWGGFGGTVQGWIQMGTQPLLAALLDATALALETGDDASFLALEEALATIMPATLMAFKRSSGKGGLSERIRQAIERQLSVANMNLARFAAQEGMSERAVQKLLEAEGYSFSQYLRHRRLSRAASDLADPAMAGVSISELCFRYGFDDPAHFSRVFRQTFGVAPVQYRARTVAAPSVPVIKPRSRGRPRPEPRPENSHANDAEEAAAAPPATPAHHHLPATPRTIHWGYFSRALKPVLTVRSGDTVTVETITQHAGHDAARMIAGDPGVEAVFHWTPTHKAVDRRGAGPLDASIYGRGAGEGFGVQILTGPIAIAGARPDDILEVEILRLEPRPSQAPGFAGRSFGSNAATWWGFHYDEPISGAKPHETVTIYEIAKCDDGLWAQALYNFKWEPQRDPFGIVHPTMDYPGVPVDPTSISRREGILRNIRVPVRPQIGTIGLAPDCPGLVDSIPPSDFGGNLDNRQLGAGARIFLPVAVPNALLSLGDPHAAQGNGEISGTAIECSMTATLKIVLHRRASAPQTLRDLTYPLIETEEEWIIQGFSQPNYLSALGVSAQSEIYRRSSLDLAMRDAFRKARRFLMTSFALNEDEAVSLLSVAVDFGVTQVVDGNWGVHASIPKNLFTQHVARSALK